MNEEFVATTNHLFDTEYKLYYRDARYFDKTEANGAKCSGEEATAGAMRD